MYNGPLDRGPSFFGICRSGSELSSKFSLDYCRLSAIIEVQNERNSKMNGYLYDDETDEYDDETDEIVTMLFFLSWVEEINS